MDEVRDLMEGVKNLSLQGKRNTFPTARHPRARAGQKHYYEDAILRLLCVSIVISDLYHVYETKISLLTTLYTFFYYVNKTC